MLNNGAIKEIMCNNDESYLLSSDPQYLSNIIHEYNMYLVQRGYCIFVESQFNKAVQMRRSEVPHTINKKVSCRKFPMDL